MDMKPKKKGSKGTLATGRPHQRGRAAPSGRKVGRPPLSESLYNERMCDIVIAAGREGKSENQMAVACNVTKNSLRNWAKSHPEFAYAFALARQLSLSWWEETGQKNLKTFGFQSGLYNKIVSSRFRNDYGEHVDLGSNPDRPVVTKIVREIIRTPGT